MNQMPVFGGQPQTPARPTITADVISGEQQVYGYYVPPGVTTFLFDFNVGLFYIKETDMRGIQQRTRVFDFKERMPQPETPQGDTSGLQSQIDELKSLILSMNQHNNNSKQKGGN